MTKNKSIKISTLNNEVVDALDSFLKSSEESVIKQSATHEK